jgi:NADP-dependent 3-hydroxy acid dehydrogenase YdfG
VTAHVFLITDCSTGIGPAVAQRMTTSGRPVAATDRVVEAVEGFAASTRLALDLIDSSAVEAAVAMTLQRHGHINVLVNNARHAISEAIEEVPQAAVRAAQER